jgi:anti-anti-sigma factor
MIDLDGAAHLAGELDIAAQHWLRRALEGRLGGAGPLILDVSEVRFMDCSTLGVLLDVARRAPSGLVLRHPTHIVSRLLSLTGAEAAGIVVEG